MFCNSYPRVVISGLSGDSGKTIVSCGLLTHFRSRGLDVTGFKKGPDYIDAAWLSLASGKPARNLDTFMMGFPAVREAFLRKAGEFSINLIEGNRGIFDGVDIKGKHSTAELSRLLDSPVIIVQDISKVTRTAAAAIVGCISLSSHLRIEGVILNKVANERHATIAKGAIEEETGIPVIGAIPKLPEDFIIPSRHLGLITPNEFEQNSLLTDNLSKIIEENIDVSAVLEIVQKAPSIKNDENSSGNFQIGKFANPEIDELTDSKKVKIGYFKDKSFSFYYPENLEKLAEAGAEVIAVSPTSTYLLDDLDALYIGGGFPEVNLKELASNTETIKAINKLAQDGLPIYAECGGLMYLAKKIRWKGKEYSLSGVLPIEINMNEKPQGHGYSEATVDNENPFFEVGTKIKGHEFHYSKIDKHKPDLESCLEVTRGNGSLNKRDGLTYKNVFASYIHVHALATPEWVNGMIKCARNYQKTKNNISVLSE